MNAPLDSRQLRAFATLARTGSFTQTARELHLSQSAISHSMKALEEDVGCRLLDRLGKKVVLTQAGEQLLHHAQKIIQEMLGARAALEQLGKWGKGRLRLGASDTACQHILPGVLREFKDSFPQCAIGIEPGDTPLLIEALLENRIDLALCLEPERETRLEFHRLFTDELMFLVGPMHPWAVGGHVVREEVPKQNYILYGKGSVTFRLIERYFREEDIALNTVVELGNMEAIKELVKLGLGVSILAPWIARDEIEEGSVMALPLGRRKLKRHWGIMHLRGRRLGLAEETFIGLCRSATQALELTEAG
ncbi:MAG TPA: LysR family transcriptional regulator [Verrucomicrobiae bacterium]